MRDDLVSVDETSTDELGRERRATDLEVAIELPTQPRELIPDIAPYQTAVPVDRWQRRGKHDLRDAQPLALEFESCLGDRRIGVGCRPVRRHRLVQPTAVERRGQPACSGGEPGVHLLGVHGRAPIETVICGLDEAVDGRVQHVDEPAHRPSFVRRWATAAALDRAARVRYRAPYPRMYRRYMRARRCWAEETMEIGREIFLSSLDTADWRFDPEVGGDMHVVVAAETVYVRLERFSATPAPIEWKLPERETVLILEGAARIEIEGGPTLDLRVGNLASIPKGAVTTWHLTTPFKELWFFGRHYTDATE